MNQKFWTGKPGAVASTAAVTPTGAIAATTVQTALAELDSEKQPTTLSLTDIGADLADDDTAPIYDLSATANRKSALSRVWTYIASKLSAFTGILGASRVEISGNISAAAWTTSGLRFKSTPGTLTDTSSSGTVATACTNKLGGNTIAASNATTYTDYGTLYLDTPTAGTNVTLTNTHSLITTGNVKVGGNLTGGLKNITEAINYQEISGASSTVTVNFSTGDVQFLYINPDGASVQITLPADPGALSKSGILFVKNNTGKAHTWNTSPAIRFVDQFDADTVPTPAAVTYWTRYTCQWNDNNAGTGSWWVTVAGRDTA